VASTSTKRASSADLDKRAVPSADTVPLAAVPVQPIEPTRSGCPVCGRVNEPDLRFCAKCGHTLASSASALSAQPSPLRSWWSRRFRSREAAARKAYRRSLPPLYRWRRVIIGGSLIALLGAGAVVATQGESRAAGRARTNWVVTRWYDVTGNLARISPANALVIPPTTSDGGTDPRALTDQTKGEWSLPWTALTAAAKCSKAPEVPTVVLQIPSARVRALEFWPGLDEKRAEEQKAQFRPHAISVTFPDGRCESFLLNDSADPQLFIVDSRSPITTMELRIETAYPAIKPEASMLSFTEVMPLKEK